MTAVRPTDRLFFAVMPDPRTAVRIADLGARFAGTGSLVGTPVLPQHLHIALWHVGDSFFPPHPDLIATLVRRAGYVEMPSLRISFDNASSLDDGAFVLRGAEGVAGLEMLRARLQAVLAAPGCTRPRSGFSPHMTLLRNELILPARRIEQPVAWTAHEFVLVHSARGHATHRRLASLPLA